MGRGASRGAGGAGKGLGGRQALGGGIRGPRGRWSPQGGLEDRETGGVCGVTAGV